MGKFSRDKGNRWQRVCKQAGLDAGIPAEINYGQSAQGGWDITIPHFGIECKHWKDWESARWTTAIKQVFKAVDGTDMRPALAVKFDRKEPMYVVFMYGSEFWEFADEYRQVQELIFTGD